MANETTAKATLGQRAMRETKEFVVLAVYLYIAIGAVIMMKTAVLHSQGIGFAPWGIAVVKAAVLAKFMLLGTAMKIGTRYSTQPLIWPTVHKALAFLVLLVVMTVLEEAIIGLLHGRPIAASIGELVGPRLWESIADIVIMLMVLVPYCAFKALDEALGEGRLVRMFFVERKPVEQI